MKFTLAQVADLLGGVVEGDDQAIVTKIEKIEVAQEGAISFLSNPKYEQFLYETNASAVLIDKDFELKEDVKTNLIRLENAYNGFTALLEEYERLLGLSKQGVEQPNFTSVSATIGSSPYVGAFAYIGQNVKIGNNVKIYPHVYIDDNVEIGDNTILYSGARIYQGCKIGSFCTVHANAVIGSDGFGFAPQDDGTFQRIPQVGNTVLEDHVSVGANTVVDCATMGSTTIGKGVKIDNLVQIAHNVEVGDNSVIVSQAGIAGSSKLGKNCIIAGQVGIVGHLSIEDNTTIGAQSGVTKNVTEPGQTLLGSPAVEKSIHVRQLTMARSLPKMLARIEKLEKTLLETSSN